MLIEEWRFGKIGNGPGGRGDGDVFCVIVVVPRGGGGCLKVRWNCGTFG